MSPSWPLFLSLLFLLSACTRARAPVFFALDRGADELFALDAELCVLRRVPVGAPKLLAPGHVPCVVAASSPGNEGLFELGPDGLALLAQFPAVVAMARANQGAWYVLARQGATETHLWRVQAPAGRELLGTFERAQALAARPEEILVGSADGTLVRLAPDGAVRGMAEGGLPVRALAPGPEPRTWWRLAGPAGGESELALLDGSLGARWSVGTGLAAEGCAPVAGEERVWLAAGSRVRGFGPGGVLAEELELPGGPWQVAHATASGLVLLSPGALLELARRGTRMQPLRSQGGFRALVTLVPAVGG